MAKNRIVTVLASGARTATSTTEILKKSGDNAKGLVLNIETTVDPAAASVVPTVDRYDEVSDTWINVLTAAAITAVGTITLKIGVGITAAANLAVNDFVYDKMRLVMTHADGDSITYSVGAEIIN